MTRIDARYGGVDWSPVRRDVVQRVAISGVGALVESTWHAVEIPMLEAVYERELSSPRLSASELPDVLGIDRPAAERAAQALIDAGYMTGSDASSGADYEVLELRLTERGRRAIGQWPPDAVDAFIDQLDQLIAAEPDEVKRSRLATLREHATDVGVEVLAGAIVAAGSAVV